MCKPIGAAVGKFLKFGTFSCIFKAIFRFLLRCRSGRSPPSPIPDEACAPTQTLESTTISSGAARKKLFKMSISDITEREYDIDLLAIS